MAAGIMNAGERLPLLRVYGLRDPGARQQAHTDVHVLDSDHVALVFRPVPDERWRAWEAVRLEWILGDEVA